MEVGMKVLEVEVKILEVDVAAITKRLLAFGARKLGEWEQEQELYRRKDFQGLLRIRKETGTDNRLVFTMKKKTAYSAVKSAEEFEMEISSAEEARKIIAALGFSPHYTVKKRRVEYCIDEAHFCFDTIHTQKGDLPTYLEIETASEADVMRWAEKLGITKETLLPHGTKEVLKHYNAWPSGSTQAF